MPAGSRRSGAKAREEPQQVAIRIGDDELAVAGHRRPGNKSVSPTEMTLRGHRIRERVGDRPEKRAMRATVR